jgi:hypothetical protein
VLKKQIGVGVIAAGFVCGIVSAALAQSSNGTTNSTLGSSGAATGTNGALHSGANKALNGAKSDTTGTVLPPPNRSATGTTNSTHHAPPFLRGALLSIAPQISEKPLYGISDHTPGLVGSLPGSTVGGHASVEGSVLSYRAGSELGSYRDIPRPST